MRSACPLYNALSAVPPPGNRALHHESFDAVAEVGLTWELNLPSQEQPGCLAVNTGRCDLTTGTGIDSCYTDKRF